MIERFEPDSLSLGRHPKSYVQPLITIPYKTYDGAARADPNA